MSALSVQSHVEAIVAGGAPDTVLEHPGMLSEEERVFIYRYILDHHVDGQSIVDAGVFLGASTPAICTALVTAGRTASPFYSFEFQIFNDNTALAASRLMKAPYKAC